MDRFAFDGGQITARQLRRTVTAYSEGALQTALESGCKDVAQVMAFLARRDARNALNPRRALAFGGKGLRL